MQISVSLGRKSGSPAGYVGHFSDGRGLPTVFARSAGEPIAKENMGPSCSAARHSASDAAPPPQG